MPISPAYRPDPRHLALGETFYDPVAPAPFPATVTRYRNQRWAARIGLDTLDEAEWVAHLARFAPLPDNIPEPLALRYHGHQFQSYNPDLGDGRGFLYAQMRDAEDGRLLDLGTKGSGQTPYSRFGDGRLTLKGGVREVLATELLEALGVYTSKSFSLVETGEALMRNDEPSPTRSSVLVRLSHSHIRIGTFQRLAFHNEGAALERLIGYCIETYQPAAAAHANPAVGLLSAVTQDVARMGAEWFQAGFVHGVLNTDNILVTGQSFDYGPWRFLPRYDARFTAAYFDQTGLYAYGRQPETLSWNLARLAESLLPLSNRDRLQAALEAYPPAFAEALRAAVLWRLGLPATTAEEDDALVEDVFAALEDTGLPFERLFFDWYGGAASQARAEASPEAATYASAAFAPLRARLLARRGRAPDHSYFQGTPQTMLIDEVEALWAPIAEADDWAPLHRKIAAVREMGAALRGDGGG